MEHTFILGAHPAMKGRADQAAFYLVGILGIFVGMLTLLSHQLSVYGLSIGLGLCLAGLGNILYAFRGVFSYSRFAPKVVIRPDELEVKPTIYSKTHLIPFDDIASISIGKRLLSVTLKASGKTHRFRTTASYPFEIREALAHVATRSNLELR